MRLAQFGRHCLPNWKHQIKSPHVSKVSHIKSFSEFYCQLFRYILQYLFAIHRTFIFTTYTINLFTNFPVSIIAWLTADFTLFCALMMYSRIDKYVSSCCSAMASLSNSFTACFSFQFYLNILCKFPF